jgi:hypothetical protein
MSHSDYEQEQGKRLNVSQRLQHAVTALAVLRSLELTDQTMQYGQLARAIGLIPPGGSWKPWHRQQVAEILQVIAAVEKQAGEGAGLVPIQFERIVTKGGQPGTGVTRNTRIVSTPLPTQNSD